MISTYIHCMFVRQSKQFKYKPYHPIMIITSIQQVYHTSLLCLDEYSGSHGRVFHFNCCIFLSFHNFLEIFKALQFVPSDCLKIFVHIECFLVHCLNIVGCILLQIFLSPITASSFKYNKNTHSSKVPE